MSTRLFQRSSRVHSSLAALVSSVYVKRLTTERRVRYNIRRLDFFIQGYLRHNFLLVESTTELHDLTYFEGIGQPSNCQFIFTCSPLPKNLHQALENDRSSVIQCRVALSSLNSLFRNWSSFVLLENHSYIKFITR